jgi:hypothetical protein
LIAATRAKMKTLTPTGGVLDGLRLEDCLRIRVSRAQLGRALRIGHALFATAEHLGFDVCVGSSGGACIVVKGHEHEVTLVEEMARTPHVPTAAELARQELYSWPLVPTHDMSPSGRLRLQLPERYDGNRRVWADRQRWRLEDKLGEVLVAVERRSEADEERRLERELQARIRHEAWERAMVLATERLIDAHRVGALTRQIDAWRLASDVRAWAAATRANLTGPDEVGEVVEWLSWAEAYADRIDPVLNPTGMPPAPEVTHQALRPFLSGWSPYGPD